MTHFISTPKSFILFAFIMLAGMIADAQQATQTIKLEVRMSDSATSEEIPFANVVLYDHSGTQIDVAITNMDGVVLFDKLKPAEYKVKGIYVGYSATEQNVDLRTSGRFLSIELRLTAANLVSCGWICCGIYEPVEDETYQAYSRPLDEEDEELLADLNDFICYPNPVREQLHVSVNGIYATAMAMISPAGKVIRTFDLDEEWEIDINLRGHPAGLYYFVCSGEGKSSTVKKVVKVD